MSILVILAVLTGIALLLTWKKWSAFIPEGVRRKSPIILGGLGVILLLYSIINSVLLVRHMLSDENKLEELRVSMPTLPIEKEDANVHNMDCNLVLIETNGSASFQDWNVKQWRASCEEGFRDLSLGGARVVTVGRFDFNEYNIGFEYDSSSRNYSSSGSSFASYDGLSEMNEFSSQGSSSLSVLGVPSLSSRAKIYLFFSRKGDPLEEVKFDSLLDSRRGSKERMRLLSEIQNPSDSGGSIRPQGLGWLNWMGSGVIVFVIASIFIGGLLPWKQGYTFLGMLIFGFFITTSLDRWAVSYAAEVSLDSKKSPITRYLAMQQLRSSFFWRNTAREAFDKANTDGFSDDMNELIRTQRARF